MSKSFLYSLLIHLILGAVFLLLLLRSVPEHQEEKISISLRSAYQPIQPACACESPTPPLPSKPRPTPIPSQPIVSKPIVTTVPKPSAPSQNLQTAAPIAQTPSPKPAPTPPLVQSAPPPSIKAPAPLPPAPPPANVEKEYLKLNLAEIRALLIQNQQYPKQAKRLRMQGDVELHFQLNANGSVEDLRIVQSSGFEILDEDAKALILKTAPQFPKPSKSVQLKLPISYILR